jgi:hypothetical protein
MPVPTICLDERLRQFLDVIGAQMSKPQKKYLVTVLLGLMLCEGTRTLVGLMRQIADAPSLSGLSRFLSVAPWQAGTMVAQWRARFAHQMQPLIAQEQKRQRANRPKRRGRPTQPLVTGYLIGDDSTMLKRKGKKMAALGHHHSSTENKRVIGHSLVQGLYVLLGHHCPLAPQLYRQKAVCEREGVRFVSKIDLMVGLIEHFEPLAGTLTHVLLDSWYGCKRIWKAARARGFVITTALRENRAVRVADPTQPSGWRWQSFKAYTATLSAADFERVCWPSQSGGREVYVHRLKTRVRKLYQCQVLIVRESLDAPLSQTRYWASSDLAADAATLVTHAAARWQIEVLFEDSKELLGLDHYQLMSAEAIVRFWTLVLAAYRFLDEERQRLCQQRQAHVTLGEARADVQRRHRRQLLAWLWHQFQAGRSVDELAIPLAA